MAGHGRAPKPQPQRRNAHAPQRGEWVDLEPLAKPILGVAHKDWSPRARRFWVAWREDPVTSQYGPADLAAIWDLAERFDELADNEQRLRMESLGLTPKGKQDRRWRTPQQVATIEKSAKVHQLKVVSPNAR